MATASNSPVVTTSAGPDYEPYRKAINEIVYSKKRWHEGDRTGNEGIKTWAANNAIQYYNQLPTDLANRLRNMDYTQAASFLESLGPSAPPASNNPYDQRVTDVLGRLEQSINQPRENPYDQQVADLLSRLGQRVEQPITSPYDRQIQNLLGEIANRINNPTVIDPRTTDEYAAGRAAIDRQVKDNIRIAQEALGATGFARSTNLAERAQTIADAGTEYLETQLVPQIAAQLQARDQQGLMNSMALVQSLSQQQGVFDNRQQAQLQNLGAMLGALTGQQQTFDSREQAQLQNLGSLLTALGGQQSLFDTREQTQFQNQLARDTFDLQRQAQEFTQQQALIQNEMAEIQLALQRTQAFGAVSETDSPILGVPAGTPTFQASEAAAQRMHQLDMLNKQLQADRSNLERRLAAEAEQARLNREQAASSAKINELLAIWEATQVAPPGLEGYGIEAGTPYNPFLTPSQQLDQLQLDQALSDRESQARIDGLASQYQAKYGLDGMTSQALASALDNPSYEAAIADFKAHEGQLQSMGVNTKALKNAIEKELNPSTAELDAIWNSLPESERRTMAKLDWRSWYKDPKGRIAGLNYWEWHSLYGPRLEAR